jgi:hypothetical protein
LNDQSAQIRIQTIERHNLIGLVKGNVVALELIQLLRLELRITNAIGELALRLSQPVLNIA